MISSLNILAKILLLNYSNSSRSSNNFVVVAAVIVIFSKKEIVGYELRYFSESFISC